MQELGERELSWHEQRGERRVLEAAAHLRRGVAHDLLVVEGQGHALGEHVGGRAPRRLGGVAPGLRLRQVGPDREKGDRGDLLPRARVSPPSPVGAELLEVDLVRRRGGRGVHPEAGLLPQLALRGALEVGVEVGTHEAPGQRPHALIGVLPATHEQHLQGVASHREHGEVDADREARDGVRVVGVFI